MSINEVTRCISQLETGKDLGIESLCSPEELCLLKALLLGRLRACMHSLIYVCVYVCVCVYLSVCVCVYVCVCMYVCMYVRMYVYMHV